MADSNVLMPKDHLQRMLSVWRQDTGLVCSPPIGGAPQNLWAELECAFLNTYQARWQCFADGIGLGFAQGKAMLWRRELLDLAGGIEVLGSEIAEDAAATKAIRALGLRVRLVAQPFMQPLGNRSSAEVWRRQLRWARLRRTTFKLFFIPELFAGIIPPPTVAVTVVAGWSIVATVFPLVAAWYAAEAFLAYRAGWQLSRRSIPVWMLRDALLPALWISAWVGNEFEWRGNPMSVAVATTDWYRTQRRRRSDTISDLNVDTTRSTRLLSRSTAIARTTPHTSIAGRRRSPRSPEPPTAAGRSVAP